MAYQALVSGHIWMGENGEKDIEILTKVDNDHEGTDIFCDIDHAIIDQIDIGDSDDYYFIVLVQSHFEETRTWEGTEYDVEHHITEIKEISDLKI